jgi:hypothetical protein
VPRTIAARLTTPLSMVRIPGTGVAVHLPRLSLVRRFATTLVAALVVFAGVGPSALRANISEWVRLLGPGFGGIPNPGDLDVGRLVGLVAVAVVLIANAGPASDSARTAVAALRRHVQRRTRPTVRIVEPHPGAKIPCAFTIRGSATTFERTLVVQRHAGGDRWSFLAPPLTTNGADYPTPHQFAVKVVLPPGMHDLRVGDYGARSGLFQGAHVTVTTESHPDDPSIPRVLGQEMMHWTVAGLGRAGTLERVGVDVVDLARSIRDRGGTLRLDQLPPDEFSLRPSTCWSRRASG